MHRVLAILLVACSAPAKPVTPVKPPSDADPTGPHREAIAAQAQPMIDAQITSALVVGIYDAGKREIYGFGAGPGGKPPDGKTLFEIGSITKVYTSLLLADAVQRKEVELGQPVSELLPPGVTVPTGKSTRDDGKPGTPITLAHLALHSSGLPRLPPKIAAHADAPDPYAGYGEEQLYNDLVQTHLDADPGTNIVYSNYGVGLLGFALGKKLGAPFQQVLAERVLVPLELHDTMFTVDAKHAARFASGTDHDMKPQPHWTFDALAGAGGLISTARDQLELIDVELDAAAGGKRALRGAMRLTQEPQLERAGDNEGLGWQIDTAGRYWHNGGTGGFRSFIGFDPKTRRGVVVLSAASTSLIDQVADRVWKLLDHEDVKPPVLATKDQLAAFAGSYSLPDMNLAVAVVNQRLYLAGPGAPKVRLLPISDHEFWIEELQTVCVFEREGEAVTRVVFVVGGKQFAATKKS